MKKRCTARGFTLIELMVTTLVGSIVIAGIYTMYTSSTKGYRIQNQTLDALANLRTGLRQVRADLRSTGFNAPGQSDEESWVETPPGITLSAFAVEIDPEDPVPNSDANLRIQPQQIRILGDFWSHRSYVSSGISGQSVTIEWDASMGAEADFDRIFNAKRVLRIEAYGVAREEQFIPIVSGSFNGGLGPSILVETNVSGINGFGAGHEVSVAGYIRYRLKNDTRRSSTSLKYDLIREELMPDGTAAPGTALIIAENIVDLQVYDMCMNTTAPQPGSMIQIPVVLQCFRDLEAVGDQGYSLSADMSNQSHLLRSVTVKLAARSPYEDEDIPFAPRPALNSPLHAFELQPDLRGAARVFELATMVTLTSIQARRQ
jgi:prepilin-type N-terminal cleavage/methylation domain-containing protein